MLHNDTTSEFSVHNEERKQEDAKEADGCIDGLWAVFKRKHTFL